MKDIVTKVNGVSTYSAEEFNPNMTELENAVSKSGQTLDPTGVNVDQLSEAMGRYGAGGADFYSESGSSNAYVLTGAGPYVKSKVYFEGMRVVFVAGFPNTLAATINANTIGVVDLKDATGAALGSNFITAGVTITAIYNDGAGEFRIIGTSRSIPFGLICMFVGAIAAIPAGWVLCDGTSGTPDLRNNFIRGAGSTFAVNQTGGSETTGSTALSIAQMPAHTHSYNAGVNANNDSGASAGARWGPGSTTGSTGSGAGHTHPNTVPPFYALAFIMKL